MFQQAPLNIIVSALLVCGIKLGRSVKAKTIAIVSTLWHSKVFERQPAKEVSCFHLTQLARPTSLELSKAPLKFWW